MQPIALDKSLLQRRLEDMATQGLRVLAFARADHDDDAVQHDEVCDGLTFLGLQAMIDPPRPEAAASIAACYQAGIQVKMITGDHPITAQAIGRQLGMQHAERVINGAEMQTIAESEYPELVENCAVFARVAPEQKLQLVQAGVDLDVTANIII